MTPRLDASFWQQAELVEARNQPNALTNVEGLSRCSRAHRCAIVVRVIVLDDGPLLRVRPQRCVGMFFPEGAVD